MHFWAVLFIFLAAHSHAQQKPRDYYQILGITKSATADEIKKAYRKKAMDSHPDRHPGDKAREELFKEASEAYEILSDTDKKRSYDRFGTSPYFSGSYSAQETASSDSHTQTNDSRAYTKSQARQTYTRASEQVMLGLVKKQHLSIDPLIQEALILMDQLIGPDLAYAKANISSHPGQNARMANAVADQLDDIWNRVGAWTQFNGGSVKVTEAAMSASFLWLKRLYDLRPETYHHYYQHGYNSILGNIQSLSGISGARPMIDAYSRVLQLAAMYQSKPWYPSAPRAAPTTRVHQAYNSTQHRQCTIIFNGQPVTVNIEITFGS